MLRVLQLQKVNTILVSICCWIQKVQRHVAANLTCSVAILRAQNFLQTFLQSWCKRIRVKLNKISNILISTRLVFDASTSFAKLKRESWTTLLRKNVTLSWWANVFKGVFLVSPNNANKANNNSKINNIDNINNANNTDTKDRWKKKAEESETIRYRFWYRFCFSSN